jgi:hypothetical protein
MPEAIALYEDLVGRCERVLGPSHFDTLGCLFNLAIWNARVGRSSEALAHLRNAVEHGWAEIEYMEDPEFTDVLRGPEVDALVAATRRNAERRAAAK